MERRVNQKDKIKVGVLQFFPERKNVEKNYKKIEELIKNAKGKIVVLPELCTTGYLFKNKKELIKIASPIPGRDTEFFEKLAREKDLYIIAGVAEKEKDKLYNTAILVSPAGFVGKYRKIHLFYKEKKIFDPGNMGFEVFEVTLNKIHIKIGIMICFDYFFPESARTLALKNAELIAHPANLVLPYCQEVVKTRCLENKVYIITANRIGIEKLGKEKLTFTGKSQITSPEGKVILRVSEDSEGLWEIDIDLSLARNKRLNRYNHIFLDRKPAFYLLHKVFKN